MFREKRRLASLIIWWCEGTKLRRDKRWKNSYHKVIEVTNTDPSMIKIFLDFIRNDLQIPNSYIKAQVQAHQDDDIKKIVHYWQEVSRIPLAQFNKTIIRKPGSRLNKKMGIFKIRIYSKDFFDRITAQLESELKELLPGYSSVG